MVEALSTKPEQIATGVRQPAWASAKHLDFIVSKVKYSVSVDDYLVDIAGGFFGECQQWPIRVAIIRVVEDPKILLEDLLRPRKRERAAALKVV